MKANLTLIFMDITLINSSFKQKEKKLPCSSFMLVNFYIVSVREKKHRKSVLQLLFPVHPVKLWLALGDDPVLLVATPSSPLQDCFFCRKWCWFFWGFVLLSFSDLKFNY